MPPDYVAAQMKVICTEGDFPSTSNTKSLTRVLSRIFPTRRNISLNLVRPKTLETNFVSSITRFMNTEI